MAFMSLLASPAVIGGGLSLVGGLLGGSAAKSSANTQADAARYAADLQQRQFDLINQQQAPYRGLGYTSLSQIGGMLGGQTPMFDSQGKPMLDANGQPMMQTGSGYLTKQFGPEDLKTSLAPNYEFMLKEGQRAARQRLNAGGSGGSDIDRGITRFAEDYASNAYQNAFNNFSAQRKDIYNTLAGIAGIGQTGQTETNKANAALGTNLSSLATGSAAVQGAGQVAAANAYGGALGNIGGYNYLQALRNPNQQNQQAPAPIQIGPSQPAIPGAGAQQTTMLGDFNYHAA
jgi:hypothetical protein